MVAKSGDRGSAVAVAVALKQWGAPFESSDTGDAFCIANLGRTELGLPGLTIGS